MNKKYLIKTIPVFFMALLSFTAARPQENTQMPLSDEELASYSEQAGQMIKFLEYVFNTLGDATVPSKEKDIIINQSYLKIFRDDQVQIEDDLDRRKVVTNKNVQAYLKDINFFFKKVTFEFNIEETTPEINESGQVYFKVTMYRNLNGSTVYGDTVNNSQIRYVEINLDPSAEELKIVSIYTTKLSEEEDLANWWYQLPGAWKEYFATMPAPYDTLHMTDVLVIADSMIITKADPGKYEDMLLSDSLPQKTFDTLYVDTKPYFRQLKKYWGMDEINLTGNLNIFSLEPLKKLSQLKSLDISNTLIDDLSPLRNLTRLQKLNCSGAAVQDLTPLHYTTLLKELNLNNTLVVTLEPVSQLNEIQILTCDFAPVGNLEAVAGLKKLKELLCRNTGIDYLTPLEDLIGLERLDVSNTKITNIESLRKLNNLTYLNIENTVVNDLEPVKNLVSLKYLYCDYTPVDNLDPLLQLPYLERIYCDKTGVNRSVANKFNEAKPAVLIVYDSGELGSWWNSLPAAWKQIFIDTPNQGTVPGKEQLHEFVRIHELNIQDNQDIDDLNPVKQLVNLDEVNISNTPVQSLEPLKENVHLQKINARGTPVANLNGLQNLHSLRWIDISGTPVSEITELADLTELEYLDIRNTAIKNIMPLAVITNLKLIAADNTNVTSREVNDYLDVNGNTVILYQTEELMDWWENLSISWKEVLKGYQELLPVPSSEQLHKLVTVNELSIIRNIEISNLEPVAKLTRLRRLTINHTAVQDISPIAKLSRLEYLNIADNPIRSVAPVTSLAALKHLDISNNQIEDVDLLGQVQSIETLNISGTPVKNLDFVSGLRKLQQLEIYNTRISNLKPVEDLKDLKVIKCYNTRISDKKTEKFKENHPGVEIIFY